MGNARGYGPVQGSQIGPGLSPGDDFFKRYFHPASLVDTSQYTIDVWNMPEKRLHVNTSRRRRTRLPVLTSTTAIRYKSEFNAFTGNLMERKTVHRSHWQNQLIEVVDEGTTRSLYFGGHVLQSSMYLAAPQKLALSYTRFMAAPLLIDDEPERILVIGVGAGSLVRFFHHHFPDAQIDGIDYSSEVIDLARSHFHLPVSPKVAIHCCSGLQFLAERKDEHNYDLILIDAFDTAGMSSQIYSGPFFDLCQDHLALSGIVCLNLWSGDQSRMEEVAMEIGVRFDSTLELPVPQRGNVICLAGRGDVLSAVVDLDSAELAFLQDRFELNFREMVRVCRKYNLSVFQRISRLFS